jgi:large subunit ribosomal protein L10
MARPEKVASVEEIKTKLTDADAALLTEYRGLTVSELATLRGSLRPAGTEYKVFKITLARRAIEDAGMQDLLPMLSGPTAFAFVKGDAVVAAKALRDFGKDNPALIIKGGLLGPRVLTPADIEQLADVEPREVLLARLAGGMKAPMNKAAGLFSAFTRNFAYGLKAYVDQRVEGGEALEEPAAAAAPEADAEPAAEAEAPAAEAEAPAAEATETEAPAAEDAAAETEEAAEAPAAEQTEATEE